MLSSLANIFRIPDLRKKVLFTLTHHRPVPVRGQRPGPRRQLVAAPEAPGRSRLVRRPRLPQPLLRRRAHPDGRLRAGDHALHHQLDHHPAAGDRHPQARGVAGPGGGRPEEAHPDHPVPDRRPGPHAVDRPGLPLPRPRRGPPRHQHRPDPQLLDLAGRVHRADPDRRHRLRHVAGRADHPAGHRSGHVDPDLRQRGGRHPVGWQGHLRGGRAAQVRHHHRSSP